MVAVKAAIIDAVSEFYLAMLGQWPIGFGRRREERMAVAATKDVAADFGFGTE